jgi:Sigma-70, region 4
VGWSRDPGDGLSAALEALPERQRHALLLRDWRGLSYDEIASRLDVSYAAVETLLFRAETSRRSYSNPPAERGAPGARGRLRDAPAAAGSRRPEVRRVRRAHAGEGCAGDRPGGHRSTHRLWAGRRGCRGRERVDGGAHGPTSVELHPPPNAVAAPSSAVSEPLRGPAAKRQGRTAASVTSPAAGQAAATPGPATPAEAPARPNPPPAKEKAGAALVVICHRTGSGKNPDLTISVAPAAVEAYLRGRDQLGPCPA